MRQRLTFLLRTFLWTLALFMLGKIGFVLYNGGAHDVSLGDVFSVIAHGFTLDASTALYVLFLPLLVALVSVWWYHRGLDVLLRVYFAIIAVALSLAFIADASLYPFWGFKLNASCLQYLTTPTEAMASVSTGYLFLRLAVLLLLACLVYLGYTRPRWHLASSSHRLAETIAGVLLLPLMIIGVRGGLGESTTNIGQVYYSQNQFLNHAAVNPVFSFLASFERSANHIVDYDFMPQDECDRLVATLYPQPSTLLPPDTILLTTQCPDVIIILMESAGEAFADAMPRLQQLKREGVNFSACYASSWRTDRGTTCTFSGYPSFPTSSVMKMPSKTRDLPNIASALKKEGYQTHYIYGGDINFTNMRSYLIAGGFENLIWEESYAADERHSAKWGVRDDITFQTLYDLITAPHDQPQLIGFSTLSSHEPWDVPIHVKDDEMDNAFYYLDQCIGQFVDRLRKTPQWQNTLIVLLPDHGLELPGLTQADALRNHIPLVWTGGAVKGHYLFDRYCNQTDLVATLLSQMGVDHSAFSWSRDVLSPSYRYPFVWHTYDNGFSIIDSTGFWAYDFDAQRVIANETTAPQRLERMGKAILQATTKDLKERGLDELTPKHQF